MELSAKEQQRLKTRFGDWAIVTGASSGIGLELSHLLAESGFHLLINARNESKLQQVSSELKQAYKIEVRVVAGDLSDPATIERLLSAARDLPIGLLINNAGFGTSGAFLKSSLHEELSMMRMNCEAVLRLTHHFVQVFKARQKGGIVFLSSIVAFQGVPFSAHYAATKAYVQSLSEGLSVELKGTGVSVLAAAPGPVESGFGSRANMQMGKGMKPSDIGVPILKALGKRSLVVPGGLSKVLYYALKTAPRYFKIRIMGMVMKGFTRHQG